MQREALLSKVATENVRPVTENTIDTTNTRQMPLQSIGFRHFTIQYLSNVSISDQLEKSTVSKNCWEDRGRHQTLRNLSEQQVEAQVSFSLTTQQLFFKFFF